MIGAESGGPQLDRPQSDRPDPGGSEPGLLTEETAWELVRAVAPGFAERSDPTRTHAPANPSLWLEIAPTGAWRTSHTATDDARDTFDIYLPLLASGDLVIGQLGQSLDGRIATETGASHFVTGPQDIVRLHRLRALVDAVVVGANTVAADNPKLTVRHVEGSNPVRIVLDPRGRLDRGLGVFSDAGAPTVTVRATPAEGVAAPGRQSFATGGELFIPASGTGHLDLGALLESLRAEGWTRILVEGGGATVSGFLAAGLLDRLHITVAPLLIGSGRPSVTLEAVTSLDQALRPPCRHFRLGGDVLFDLDLSHGNSSAGSP